MADTQAFAPADPTTGSHPAPAVSPTTKYLNLGGDTPEPSDWSVALSDLGFAGHTVAALDEANLLADSGNVSFAICELPSDTQASFSPLFECRSSTTLPIVAVGSRTLTRDELETLRRRGVAAVLPSPTTPSERESFASRLKDANGCFRRRSEIRESDLAQQLQEMARASRSGLLLTCCPHTKPLSRHLWAQETSSPCSGDEECRGWSGRVYLLEGEPYFAETPNAVGLEAMAELLAMEEGRLCSFEEFVEPTARNLWPDREKSLESLFLAASDIEPRRDADSEREDQTMNETHPDKESKPDWLDDFEQQQAEESALTLSPIRSVGEPDGSRLSAPQARESAGATAAESSHTGLGEQLLERLVASSASLTACTRADNDGNVVLATGVDDPSEGCAVALMCDLALTKAADALGLGTSQRWSAASDVTTIYLERVPTGFLLLTGSNTENQAGVMARIQAARNEAGEDE